jgi:hypothetical protein
MAQREATEYPARRDMATGEQQRRQMHRHQPTEPELMRQWQRLACLHVPIAECDGAPIVESEVE